MILCTYILGVFNKQSPEQCKPYESSFSDGCPPADWCIGCTVCDCDANGRWDCHVLSFCPDKKGKKQMKKRRGPMRNHIAKRQSKTSTTKDAINQSKKTPKKSSRKSLNKQNVKKSQLNQNGVNHHKINPVKGTKTKKFAPVKKPKLQEKKLSPNMKKAAGNPLVIKKGASTNKSLNTKPSNVKANKNDTVEVAQKVVKQFMSTMQKMMRNIEKKTAGTTKQSNKIVRKRSMGKQENKKTTKKMDNKPKFVAKPIPMSKTNKKNKGKKTTPKPYTSRSYKKGRNKRQINVNDSNADNLSFNGSTERASLTFQSIKNTKTSRTDIYIFNNSLSNSEDVYSYTDNAIRLEMNKEIYITDYKIFEDRGSTKHGNFFYDVDNLLNSKRSSNNMTLTTPRLFGNRGLDSNQNNSTITSDMLISTTENTGFAKYSENIVNETSLRLNQNINIKEAEIRPHDKKSTNNLSIELDYDEYNNNNGCKFWTLLRTLLDTNKNNTKQVPQIPKRFTIFTKIRRLFRKIFHKNKKNICYENGDLFSKYFKTMGFDYEKSNYCKLKLKEKIKLRQKMRELRNESENILMNFKIIKGLLHILELNTNETRTENKPLDLYKHDSKLNTIVKAAFNKGEITQRLTQDQRTQIDYIKSNIHTFVKSMGKFAKILDEIIQIGIYHNKKYNNLNSTSLTKNKNYKNGSENKESDTTIQQKLHKLKELMLNYNILQNKFINQINLLINNLEMNKTSSNTIKRQVDLPIQISKNDAIETNSANIIRNIRKLKVLADKLYVHSRRKRDTISDTDAMEYLLILMEYLLKRHAPANPPVNDGIDLLIEAIKTAPDVKPIRKKVMDYIPGKFQFIPGNSSFGSPEKLLQEETNQIENTSLEENKNNLTTSLQSHGDDDDDEENIDEIYQKFKSFNDSSSEQKQDNELDSYADSTTSKSLHNINIFKIKDKASKNTKPEVINENLINSGSSTIPNNLVLEVETSTEYFATPSSNNENAKSPKTLKSHEKQTNQFFVDTKANIDWIEENFRDTKQLREIEMNLSTPKTLTATRTVKQTINKNVNNLSEMSNEIKGDRTHKNKAYMEKIMTKKELELLNSLDYVIEKNIDDEATSKDDKYSSDDFV